MPDILLHSMKSFLLEGTLHDIPEDLESLLLSDEKIKTHWNALTPLARNEWICWLITAKKSETRLKRLRKLKEDLMSNKKRPCCWPGCPHHNPKTARWFG